MANLARTLVATAMLLYLAAIVVPCPPAGAVLAVSSDAQATITALCPCHVGHATPSSGVGADWQGPPIAPLRVAQLDGGALPTLAAPRSPGRCPVPPSPIPIA